jgi:phospholipid-binding lipoprotein MlaA
MRRKKPAPLRDSVLPHRRQLPLRLFKCGALLLTVLHLVGCASLPPGHEPDPQDRFERYNRAVSRFNDRVDRAVVRPVANAYVNVTPAPVRTSIGNFFENLSYASTIPNDLLQMKFKPFATDTLRLLVNTTGGIGGLFDPATQMGIPTGSEDFGQTLGRWGVPPGPYFVLPFLGPSTVRDTGGFVADQYTSPLSYASSPYIQNGLTGLDLIHHRSELLPLQDTLDNAFDPYVVVRSAYLQRREYQVKDGKVPDDETEILNEDSSTTQPNQ